MFSNLWFAGDEGGRAEREKEREREVKREMENITASEVAGFCVGTLLLCATIAAPKIDAFFSASQRSSLGMCKKCGDLKRIACSNCKGAGFVKAGGLFSFSLVDDQYQSTKARSSPKCTKCNGRGYFGCPECSVSNPSST
ncbi:hypothetical protein RJ641_022989 [Dillenia turbinata]|uniref:Uncharacterized protein n=1 Tax=Dillenia turbinata TaxID=194707 RepID=A0AAN8UAI7_9MAGN